MATATVRDVAQDSLQLEARSAQELLYHGMVVGLPPLAVVAVAVLGLVAPVWFAIAGAMYVLTGIGLTMGFHRYFAHRSYETSPWFASILAILGCMAAQEPFFVWVAGHRQHHRFSDHAGDPHSPHGGSSLWRGILHAHVGWLFRPKSQRSLRYIPDLWRDPRLVAIDSLFPVWVAAGLAIPAVVGWMSTGTGEGALLGFLWGGPIRIFGVNHITWSVNSLCHTWGSRAFATADRSTNNAVLALCSLGEGWHNNHHAFPRSARHGLHWWEVDLTWFVIKACAAVGLVWRVRLAGSPERGRRSPGALC